MRTNASFDYAVIRVVPRVEREEFVNAGVLFFCLERRYIACRIQLDTKRLRTLAPDVDVAAVTAHLAALVHVCSGNPEGGPMARLSQRERFHWLTAPRSTMVQVAPVKTGVCPPPNDAWDEDSCEDLQAVVDAIVARVIDPLPPDHNAMKASSKSRR